MCLCERQILDKYCELIKVSITMTRLAARYLYYNVYLITCLCMHAHSSRWGMTAFPFSHAQARGSVSAVPRNFCAAQSHKC